MGEVVAWNRHMAFLFFCIALSVGTASAADPEWPMFPRTEREPLYSTGESSRTVVKTENIEWQAQSQGGDGLRQS